MEDGKLSRLERLALVIGAFERPVSEFPERRLIQVWRILHGGERPKKLANKKLETLRHFASVIAHKRIDLRAKAELAVRRLGYDFLEVEALVERLRAGARQEAGQR